MIPSAARAFYTLLRPAGTRGAVVSAEEWVTVGWFTMGLGAAMIVVGVWSRGWWR